MSRNSNEKNDEKEIPIENRFDEIEEIYLIKIFESDCIFARSYSSNFEQMLINQRTSFAQSDLENLTWASNYLTVNQNRKNLVSEEVVIPLRYEGYYKN